MSKIQYTNQTRAGSNMCEQRRRNWQMQVSQQKATMTAGSCVMPQSNRGGWWRNTISHCSPHQHERTLFTPSFEALPESGSAQPGRRTDGGADLGRRQSFLYHTEPLIDRPGSRTERFGPTLERGDSHYVTPFAQVLSILKRAHTILAHYSKQLDKLNHDSNKQEPIEEDVDAHQPELEDHSKSVTEEELERVIRDFDWCLEVLESLQCKRSVSSLARAKFCRILSRELSTSLSFSDGVAGIPVNEEQDEAKDSEKPSSAPHTGSSKQKINKFRPYLSKRTGPSHPHNISTSSSQVTDYIYKTFVEDDGVLELEYNIQLEEETSPESCRQEHLNGAVEECQPAEIDTQTSNAVEPTIPDSGLSDMQVLKNLWMKESKFDVESLAQFVEQNKQSSSPDLFLLDRLTDHCPLSTFGLHLLLDRGILANFSIPISQMYQFLQRAERLYRVDAPFHNSIHATDVLHTMDKLFCFNDLQSMFSDLEVFSTLFACIIHDIDHPAVTNQYLINTNNELAILYNDKSVLENHHLYIGFDLLHSEPQVDITKHLTTVQRQLFRKIVISLVLATDMSKHMTLLADLKTMVESQRASGSNEIKLDTLAVRIQILECLVHAADLSNPTKPLNIYRQWVERITEELFQQGDREREAGLEISPMCDRHTSCVPSSQVSFIDYIVYPLWETLSDLMYPDARQLLDNIQANREWYANLRKENKEAD
ncbi:3' 5'-cyclic-nucleotide phosphodiesterase [Clonorchis sinensis]|uniref:Phosphodiesterase n=2 Tax=Clonorchis sinensis TaxID=79923 RepID=G7YHN2_CLOSI|nr:3' 5'-cyclic-nucleotide phosphodiesterase [Clonorchis sinensis]